MWVLPFTSLEPWAPGGSGLLGDRSSKETGLREVEPPENKASQRRAAARDAHLSDMGGVMSLS